MGTQLSSAQKSQQLLDSTRRPRSWLVWGFLALPRHDVQVASSKAAGSPSFLEEQGGRINTQKALEKQWNSPWGAEQTQCQPKIQEAWSSSAH